MRAALVVSEISPDQEVNLASILKRTDEAATAGAGIVLFPEAALTGLANDDDPVHDLPLGQTIPGHLTDTLARKARRHGIYLAIGLLEREQNMLYDSAVLFSPAGDLILKYRRIDPRWHGRKADPAVYCQGSEMPVAETTLGTFAFAICGDLFNDDVVARLRDLRPQWLLYPFARGFNDYSWDQGRWDRSEKAEYLSRVKQAGITTLMANSLAIEEMGGDFGGAMAVRGDGTVLAEHPLGKAGMVVIDI
ncbi:MAG: carbon-nitrogen hydrolase family protein [Candidatus Edwardsbacteria bacterium]|jgi:N-carbamoylputrescine amidase|nr:carbon-nitrogen hydrolase family protein [Candidatus Edwardsbacteria bacterium]